MNFIGRMRDIAPQSIRRLSRKFRADMRASRNERLSAKDVFTEVYAQGLWGGDPGTFFSGPGSNDEAARPYADFVKRFITEHDVKRVVDLGCGDFRVGRLIADCGISYTGVDVVAPLIAENTQRHGSPKVQFRCADITSEVLPEGDLCLIREVFQHLSNAQVSATLARLSDYRHVLVTEVHPDDLKHYHINRDKAHGATSRIAHFSVLQLDKPPFNVKHMKLVFEVDPPYFESYAIYGKTFKLKTFLISRA